MIARIEIHDRLDANRRREARKYFGRTGHVGEERPHGSQQHVDRLLGHEPGDVGDLEGGGESGVSDPVAGDLDHPGRYVDPGDSVAGPDQFLRHEPVGAGDLQDARSGSDVGSPTGHQAHVEGRDGAGIRVTRRIRLCERIELGRRVLTVAVPEELLT